MRVKNLASGSGGNSTLIESAQGTRVLVDCGLHPKHLSRHLQREGIAPDTLDAVFITHEHGDHAGAAALPIFAELGVPLWMSAGTASHLRAPLRECIRPERAQAGHAIHLRDLTLLPLAVPHDAAEPLQLLCEEQSSQRRLGILTDCGEVSTALVALLATCHALMLESNHDPVLLARGPYPPMLKARIASTLGHLSNDQAASTLRARAAQPNAAPLGWLLAAHISARNNSPSHVRASLLPRLSPTTRFEIASQSEGAGWLEV